jgi:hypothetical protein
MDKLYGRQMKLEVQTYAVKPIHTRKYYL